MSLQDEVEKFRRALAADMKSQDKFKEATVVETKVVDTFWQTAAITAAVVGGVAAVLMVGCLLMSFYTESCSAAYKQAGAVQVKAQALLDDWLLFRNEFDSSEHKKIDSDMEWLGFICDTPQSEMATTMKSSMCRYDYRSDMYRHLSSADAEWFVACSRRYLTRLQKTRLGPKLDA